MLLTDREIIETLRTYERCGRNQTATARTMGLSRSTIQGRLGEAAQRGLTAETPIPDHEPAVVDSRILRLEDENRRLRTEIKDVHRDNLNATEVRESILGLTAETAPPPEWLIDVSEASGVTGVPCTIWSDWHLGERVQRAEVNGVNEFNLAIAEGRIHRLVERTVDLCFSHMTNPSYPGIVVNLLGDIVSGEIHQELSETNEDELFPIILWARDRLIAALKSLADHFGRVYVACSPGNHGRTTKRPQAKRYIYKNADWLVFCLVERHFADVGDDRIRLSIPETGECLYSIYGRRFMAVHGDDLGVKGGDGIIGAIGPIMRGEIKMRNSQAQVGRDYDTLVMGHWHQMLWLPRAVVNNTLKGYDEFARRNLRAIATPASQALWFTHPKRGITARWEVILDDTRVVTNLPWVSWEQRGRAA